MDTTAPQCLIEHFSKLEDPRVELKREPTEVSVRKKRIRAALNDSFRDKVLMGQ